MRIQPQKIVKSKRRLNRIPGRNTTSPNKFDGKEFYYIICSLSTKYHFVMIYNSEMLRTPGKIFKMILSEYGSYLHTVYSDVKP